MFYEKVKNNENTIGVYINLCDSCVSKIAGIMGFDYAWIDMEHSYLSYEAVLNHITILQGLKTAAIVRVPQDDLTATKKVMEMGPDGIIFPMVRTKEEVDELISYTLYPPYGTRGFGPMNAIDYGNKDVSEYITEGHKKMMRFIQIEHIETVKNLDEIMKNEYIDGYIFGPNDLSGSVNELCNIMGETTQNLVKEAIAKLKAKNKYIGLASGLSDEKILRYWHSLGISMISAGADYGFISEGAKEMYNKLSKILKEC